MRHFLLRLIINAIAIAITAEVLPGITVRDNNLLTLLVIALIFGLVNSLLKPVLAVLTCPVILLTLGLFVLVLNGAMLLITDALAGNRFEVDGWGAAILGGIIMSLVVMIAESIFHVDDKDDHDRDKKKNEPFIIQG